MKGDDMDKKDKLPFIGIVGYDGSEALRGGRVELHPATDAWMRGMRYGTIEGVAKDGSAARVKLDKARNTVTVSARNLRAI